MSKFFGFAISMVFIFATLASSSGCDETSKPESCAAGIQPGPAPIRRLTRVEYNNTVFQLLGDSSRPADSFPADEEAGGFDNQAAAQTVSPLLAEQYQLAAENLAQNNVDKLMRDIPACTSSPVDQAACRQQVEQLIADFGKRAFRRPLTPEEISLHLALFDRSSELGGATATAKDGVELILQAMLQSPHFLYRVEFGMPDPVEGDVVPLTSYEIASRLSYLLWNTMPDAALFEAADADELMDPEQIKYQARRMLDTPRARAAVKNFHRQWLRLDDVETSIRANGKNRAIYPDYREPLVGLWRQETEEFLEYAIFEENASVDTLFTANYTMMNRELAEFYGVENKPAGDTFERVDLDPDKYSGFLTHAGLLALYAKPDRSSPIHRGKFVRQSLLCQNPPPPPDIVPEPPTVDPTQTTRNQFLAHSQDPLCKGCHRLMDPIGFGFEHFDGIGRYRETEWGLPIDASGDIVDTVDADGPFDGVVELGKRLGNSEQVRDCVTKQWFRFAYGRAETEQDTCSLDVIKTMFASANYDIKELIIALTQTDAFRYRQAVTPVEDMQ